MVAAPELDHDYLLLATRDGQIKKTALKEFAAVRRAGLIAFNLQNGDELVLATTAHAGDDVMVASDAGRAVRFAVDSLRKAHRPSGGVRAIRLPEGGRLVGLLKVASDQELLTVTANGFGKRTPESEYPRKGRGGKGMIAHKVSGRTGALVSLHQVTGDEQLVLISEEGKFIRTAVKSIRACGRSTQGVTVMKTDDGMDVAAVAIVRPSAWEGSSGPEAPANGRREGKPASAARGASSRNGAARNGAGSGRRRNGR